MCGPPLPPLNLPTSFWPIFQALGYLLVKLNTHQCSTFTRNSFFIKFYGSLKCFLLAVFSRALFLLFCAAKYQGWILKEKSERKKTNSQNKRQLLISEHLSTVGVCVFHFIFRGGGGRGFDVVLLNFPPLASNCQKNRQNSSEKRPH